MSNRETHVIQDFGSEWSRFQFLDVADKQRLSLQAKRYLNPIFDYLESNKHKITLADFGAGSGRWSEFLHDYALKLYVVEPSQGGFGTLQERFSKRNNVILLNQRIEDCQIPDRSLDLAVSLGVIHHLEEPLDALARIATKLKPNGLFLGYIYYNLEGKGFFYRTIWKFSHVFRLAISRMPKTIKFVVCDAIAILIYFPLSQCTKVLEKLGLESNSLPLHHYSQLPFEVMRNDALDRFGTRLERRYSKKELVNMLEQSGFNIETLSISSQEPYWTFSIRRKGD